MAIKINNVTAIDDSRNVSAGIVTIGSGSSATIINGTTGTVNIGTGITMVGSSGNISIAGTITAGGFNIPASIVSFSPANGATNVAITTSIVLTFNQAVGVATTGFAYIRSVSAGGTTLQTLGVGNIQSIPNGISINVTTLPILTAIFPVIPAGFIKSTSGNFIGLNTTGASSYSYTTRAVALGDAFGGGYWICAANPVKWIVAPSSSEVARLWASIGDANTRAQQVSGCTGWFIPDQGQLQNPGYTCKTYWDSPIPTGNYWSSSTWFTNTNCVVRMGDGFAYAAGGNENATRSCFLVRAFRCVVY
jgi:hypothetical protein